MKKYILIYVLIELLCTNLFSQNHEEMYVPIIISYYPGNNYKIPIEDDEYKSYWVNILTFHNAYPRIAEDLFAKDKVEYRRRNNKLLFTRSECDTFVRNYVYNYTTRMSNYYKYGEGAYYIQERSGDREYYRCVCLPAKDLMDLGHGDAAVVGVPIKYIEPKDFVFKFKRYKLDSLDLAEAPYYTIFPLDINPSFDCSKATTAVEKAICRNAELSELDRELARLYKEALKREGEKIKIRQREWIAERDKKCEGKDNEEITQTLIKMYKTRIEELKR